MANQIDQQSPGQMQAGAVLGQVLRPSMERMAADPPAPVVRGAVMPAQPAPQAGPTPAGNVMERFVPPTGEPAAAFPKEDMRPFPTTAGPVVGRESYVRLGVRVVHGKMSIVNVAEVDGPLTMSSEIVGAHAYEVVLDAKTIAIAGIPDIGVSRSFPRPGTHEHFITERDTFEFNVRVPRAALPENAIPRVAVTLYRFPDASRRIVSGAIARQPGLQATVIAKLDALPETAFEAQARTQVRQIFPNTFR